MRVGRLPPYPYFRPGDSGARRSSRGSPASIMPCCSPIHGPVVRRFRTRCCVHMRSRSWRRPAKLYCCCDGAEESLSKRGSKSWSCREETLLAHAVRRRAPSGRAGTRQPEAERSRSFQHGSDRPVRGRRGARLAARFSRYGRGGSIAEGGPFGRKGCEVAITRPEQPFAGGPGPSTPSLADIDKVDVNSSYGTTLFVPPCRSRSRNKRCCGMFALAANDKFHYPKYSRCCPHRTRPGENLRRGLVDSAEVEKPEAEGRSR